MKGSVDCSQQTAKAEPEQGDLLNTRMELNCAYSVVEITVDISVKSPPAIRARRGKPVGKVEIDTFSRETFHNALARYEVEDVRTFDQGVDQQQRGGLGLPYRS